MSGQFTARICTNANSELQHNAPKDQVFMSNETLFQWLDKVQDENTFIEFIDALSEDRINSTDEWQNGTIESFLERSHAWAIASINGLQFYKKSNNPWKRCADILYMGKIYE